MGASQSTTTDKVPQQERVVSLCEKQLRAIDLNARSGSQRPFRAAKDSNGGSSDGTLSLDDFDRWQHDFESVPAHQVLGTILSQQDPLANLTSRKVTVADIQVFNHKLTTQLKTITNQKQSGRCWLFAALNMARIAMAKKYNVDDFQFSQAYPMFYDHLNKANVFLENIIDLAEEKLDSRIINDLVSDPVEDGGEWVFALNLFERYGLVPQALYPESFSSSNSNKMNDLVNTKLREHCLELRRLYQSTKAVVLETTGLDQAEAAQAAVRACRARKEEQLSEIYTIITMCLGTPPSPHEKYTYEFYDKKGQYQSFKMTPLELLADLAPAFKPAEYVSIVNQPNHELGKLYTVDRAQNVWGGRKTQYINVEMDHLEQAVIKMIKADEPVWFACDARLSGDRIKGIWDVDVRDIEGAFGTKLGMDKADRLDSRDSYPSHAMMIRGVHVEDGKLVRVLIENSWGPDYGEHGYFVCTAEWFRQYTYEVIVPKKMAPVAALKILDAGNPVVLPPWATMASRARRR